MPSKSAAPLSPSADFADWLPPMLVKELRQGLRTHVFVIMFVLIQAAMLIFTGVRLSGTNPYNPVDGFMWLALSGALLFIMPARGLSAISDEDKAKTLDLVQLTHLGSFQIVLQKWFALVSQALLLLIAVLPYIALRYFFGGIDVVRELLSVVGLFCLSLPLTAFSIALSTAPRAIRTLAFLLASLVLVVMSVAFLSNPWMSGLNVAALYSALFACVLGSAFALSVAAARISAPAENASARIRIIALASVLLSLVGRWLADDKGGLWSGVALVVMLWAGLEAMAEQTCDVPSLYSPWVRRRFLGRLAGRLLYPGWAPGLAFVALLCALYFPHLCLDRTFSPTGLRVSSHALQNITLTSLLGMTMVFPALLLSRLPGMRHRRWAYFGVQAVCFVYWLIIYSVASDDGQRLLAAFTPLSAFTWSEKSRFDFDPSDPWFLIAAGVNSIALLIIVLSSRAEFRKIRLLERQASSLLNPA